MPKLYVFAIGGTGIRVLKSLVFLLASGVKSNASEIVPIIIDVDKGGGDLTRTIETLNKYKSIYNSIGNSVSNSEYDGFFKTKITDLFEVPGAEFRLNIQGIQNLRFQDYIELGSLSDDNERMAKLLFSESNLDLRMDVGFKGNPNLGSVVLNQFEDNPDFRKFATSFEKDDRIFIISSIHGGTGASGFPLLVKNLRNADNTNIPKSADIANALIGAITVLPYFKLQDGEIKSQDFISKTIAALEYYKENLLKSVDALYYIGLNDTNTYENKPGGEDQKNDAHIVELASALSIVDFAMKETNKLLELKEDDRKYYEFGIRGDSGGRHTFTSLSDKTNDIIKMPLSKFWFFNLYCRSRLEKTINRQPWSNRGNSELRIDKSYLTSRFYKTLESFHDDYDKWLRELGNNQPAFYPFNNIEDINYSLNCINGVESKVGGKIRWKEDYVKFDDSLNKHERRISKVNKNRDEKFIEIFNKATELVFRQKY